MTTPTTPASPDSEREELIRRLDNAKKDGLSIGECWNLMDEAAALLAATPAREWVGLTDEERISLEMRFGNNPKALSFQTESRLREKNAATPAASGGETRPCHVFNVTKHGPLTEWEPTTMAFALPDGKHALYTHPQPSALPDEVVKDAVLMELDGLGDDAAVHIYPDDLEKCSRSECAVTVYSVRVGDFSGARSVPLFSREQIAAAIDAAMLKEGK